MEDEAGLTLVSLEHFVVQIELVPVFEHSRLARGQTGSHREFGLRQIQGRVVVHSSVVPSLSNI